MGCKRGRKPRKDNENYRKGPKGQVLRKGESYREDKELYYFQYRDSLNRKRVIYRKDLMALRKIEAEVNKDLADNIRTYEADHMMGLSGICQLNMKSNPAHGQVI